MSTSERSRLFRLLPHLAHLAMVLFLFAPVLFGGRMFYARDVSISYYPDYVFLYDSLRRGVWPLWNPTSDAGAPFFMPYPVVVSLVASLGPALALGAGPALHVLLAMCGTTALARQRGVGAWGAWLAGVVLGLSGYMQSSLLFPVFLAAAWAPFILLVYEKLRAAPTPRLAAALGALGALQLSTLGGEIVLQTALIALVLGVPRSRRALGWLFGAGVVAALLSAPVLLGSRAILEGTPRGAGFSPQVGLSFSAPWPVLLEAVFPRFLGNPHTFSDYGFWGQPFFPDGYPFFLSLYLGPLALLLALLAGRDRLFWLGGLGILMSLGSHGPLAGALGPLMHTFRVPVKFFFLTTLATALLAGRGLERARAGPRPRLAVLLPSLLLLLLAAVVRADPGAPARVLSGLLPELSDWRAQVVASTEWPMALLLTGSLGLAAGLALLAGPRLTPLAGLVTALDLVVAALPLNPTAERSFYELRPDLRAKLAETAAEGRYRYFSYGLIATPPVRFQPGIVARNRDYWLYAMERQSLLPRAHVLDGLEGAFDEDRTGLLPLGATLPSSERDPAFFARHYRRLRLANVRFVLSYRPLPDDLVALRGRVAFPEILDPLLLYELRDPLPRAFWVGRTEVLPPGDAATARLEDPAFDPRQSVLLTTAPPALPGAGASSTVSVALEQPDAHTVRVQAESPPGMVVVSQGYDAGWHAELGGQEVPLFRANGRYWGLSTPGGARQWTLRFKPRWVAPALLLFSAGLVSSLALLTRRGRVIETAGGPSA